MYLESVAFFFVFVALLLISGSFVEAKNIIDFYGYMAACGVMMLTVFVSLASLRLKKVFPKEYKNAYFRLPTLWLTFFAIISIVTSLGLVTLLFFESKRIMMIYLTFTLLVTSYYFIRKRWMQKRNLPMGNIFKLES